MSKPFLTKRKIFNKQVVGFIFAAVSLFFSVGTGYALPLYPAPPIQKKSGNAVGRKPKYVSDYKKIKPKAENKSMPVIPSFRKKVIIPNSVSAVRITLSRGETKTVYLSRRFINRIIFPHYVSYAKTSKTGDVSITINGKNAVVVFSPYIIQSGLSKKIVYPKIPSSILLKSGNQVISLLVVPKNIPPQTVYIEMPGYSAGKSLPVNGGFSKYVGRMLKDVYEEKVPNGYMASNVNVFYKSNYPQLSIRLIKKYTGKFIIYEYIIQNVSGKILSLSNKEFLYLNNNILAISLSSHHLFKNTYTRLFIMGDNYVR